MTEAKALPPSPRVPVEVTSELIAGAVPRDSGHCMIAEAVKAARPDATFISVDIQTIRFTDPRRGVRFSYLTPRLAQLALLDFDAGIEPMPFRFVLRGGQTVRSNGGKGKRRPSPERSDAQQKAMKKAEAVNPQRETAKLVHEHGQGPSNGGLPTVRGGLLPPTGMLTGGSTTGKSNIPIARRRSFGLRAMDRAK